MLLLSFFFFNQFYSENKTSEEKLRISKFFAFVFRKLSITLEV